MKNNPKNNLKTSVLLIASILVALILFVVLSSCTCESRLSSVRKKCPELLKKDTLKIRDTFFTKEVHRDTVFKFNYSSDTITLKQDNLLIKYFYNTKDSTVYIKGQCDTVRIIREYHVPYDKIVYKETFWSFLKQYWYVFVFVIMLLIFLNFIKK